MPPPPTLPFDRTHLRPGDRIAVAVSSGADSTALLLALHAANNTPRESLGIGLTAVHVHHNIRPADETEADIAFLHALTKKLDIPLSIHHADVPARAAATRETLEEAAREVRYDHFRTLLASGHADAILTAHTLDDQAETVLLKLLRGAWTRGLSAIHPLLNLPIAPNRTGKILRPLLQTRRAEIISYLTAQNQLWREDSTNADTAFTRNRIRHELLPQLRAFNPSIDQTLANLAELAREDESHWQAELARILPQLLLPGKPTRGGGRAVGVPVPPAARGESVPTNPSESTLAIEIERLRPLSPAARRRVLRAAAERLGARLSFDETNRLLALCGFLDLPTARARTGSAVHLPAGLRAERSPRELRLYREKPASLALNVSS